MDEIADATGFAPAQVRDLLTDETTRVDDEDQIYVVDDALSPAGELAAVKELSLADTATPQADLAPLEDSFNLHSRPGANRILYLDFDPTALNNSQWKLANGTYPGWDTDGNPATFSTSERAGIQKIWAIMAEDFAPFDVDVTTQDPGSDRLNRSSSSDTQFGMRVQFSSGSAVSGSLCGGGCGGVAYVGVFNRTNSSALQPAWVFPSSLGNSPTNMADAASHEAGHTLGLSHDGTGSKGYYSGHNGWGPIMGAPYGSPITQWNNGTYLDARNQEDDMSVMQSNGIALRPDEAGNTLATAAKAIPAVATITSRDDVDVYNLGSCTGTVKLTADAHPTLPDLDIKLDLLNASGTVLASDDPISTKTGTGMSAQLSQSVSTGVHYARIGGVGRGNTTTGYDDYGSLGNYSLKVTGCGQTPVVTVPTEPQSLTASTNGTSITATWAAPKSDGGSPVTGYQMRVTNEATGIFSESDTTATTYTTADQKPGTYAVSITARNTTGTSASVTTSVQVGNTTPTPSPTAKPTSKPTTKPTPTSTPTSNPTSTPTADPTSAPTSGPTATPPSNPTPTPTSSPTATPTSTPTSSPTATPNPPKRNRIRRPVSLRSKRGAHGGELSVTARWRAVVGADSYRVRAMCVSGCVKGSKSGRARTFRVDAATTELSMTLSRGKWTVKVRAMDTVSKSRWSVRPKAIRSR